MRAGAGLPAASRTMVGDMNPARSGRARGLTRHCVCMECFFRRHRGGGPGVRERGSGMRAREGVWGYRSKTRGRWTQYIHEALSISLDFEPQVRPKVSTHIVPKTGSASS
jgi:hypothetical protein